MPSTANDVVKRRSSPQVLVVAPSRAAHVVGERVAVHERDRLAGLGVQGGGQEACTLEHRRDRPGSRSARSVLRRPPGCAPPPANAPAMPRAPRSRCSSSRTTHGLLPRRRPHPSLRLHRSGGRVPVLSRGRRRGRPTRRSRSPADFVSDGLEAERVSGVLPDQHVAGDEQTPASRRRETSTSSCSPVVQNASRPSTIASPKRFVSAESCFEATSHSPSNCISTAPAFGAGDLAQLRRRAANAVTMRTAMSSGSKPTLRLVDPRAVGWSERRRQRRREAGDRLGVGERDLAAEVVAGRDGRGQRGGTPGQHLDGDGTELDHEAGRRARPRRAPARRPRSRAASGAGSAARAAERRATERRRSLADRASDTAREVGRRRPRELGAEPGERRAEPVVGHPAQPLAHARPPPPPSGGLAPARRAAAPALATGATSRCPDARRAPRRSRPRSVSNR